MSETAQPTPTCKRCGCLLHTADEVRNKYCHRCPIPLGELPPLPDDERFCCGSDPPCPSCPYVIGWDDSMQRSCE
jgi:hypothetical protein